MSAFGSGVVGAVDFGLFGRVVGMEAGGFFFGGHFVFSSSIAELENCCLERNDVRSSKIFDRLIVDNKRAAASLGELTDQCRAGLSITTITVFGSRSCFRYST